MLRFVLRRLIGMLPTLFGVTLITFALLHLAPGDPTSSLFHPEVGTGAGMDEAIERFRAEHLLDRPVWVQYAHYVGPFNFGPEGPRFLGGNGRAPWHGLLAGQLGHEFRRPSVSVAGEIVRRLRVTVPLAFAALALAFLVSVPAGILTAVRRGTRFELCASVFLFALYALPVFWVGLVLQLVFGATGLGWLPVLGIESRDAADLSLLARLWDLATHAVLPIVTLAYGAIAYLSRQMRSSVLDVIRQDYVRTARAKGLSEQRLVLGHVLRNSLLPMVTLFGQLVPVLLGGSILVESVFDLPGLGRYAYEGMLEREYNVILGTVLLSALFTWAAYLLSDVLSAWVDPRIRYD